MLRLATAERGDSATPLRRGNMRRVSGGQEGSPQPPPAPPGRAARAPDAGLVAARVRPGDAARPSEGPTESTTRGVEVGRHARREVALENHLASRQEFDPTDPRWVLALKAAESIEGGRAAVLPPEKRARLLALGTRLGLRPFDSHLVLAIVQDGARSGEGAVGPQPTRRLALLRRPDQGLDALGIAARFAVAALLATAMAAAAVAWIIGA